MPPGVPYFPQIIPANSVIGRLTSGAGPAEAIPMSALGGVFAPGTSFANFVALEANNNTTITLAFVRGANSAGDGGEGIFEKVTSGTPDGGVIFADAAAQIWRRAGATSAWVSVLWYGAKGDGTTDDTTAINAALSAISSIVSPTTQTAAMAGGGTVFFPGRRTYRFTNTLYLNSNVHLIGEDCGPIAQSPFSVTPPKGAAILLYDNATLNTIAIDATGFWLTTQAALSGTASAGASGSITIGAGKTVTQSVILTLTGGTGSGQSRPGSYNSGTGVFSVSWPWDTTPDNTSQWAIAAHAIGDRMTQLISPAEIAIEADGVGTFVQGIAIKNLVLISNQFVTSGSSGHYEGIRLNVCPTAVVENALIYGFNVSLEEVGSAYCFVRNIISAALMTGFAWIESDHAVRVECLEFGINMGIVSITATNRPWFVDFMAKEGTDPQPTYATAHYFVATSVGTSIGCDGEGCDRSYLLGGGISETFIGCHMERWNHIGFYTNGTSFTWLGGDFYINSAAPAFSGISCNGTIDGLQPDPGTNASAVTIGAFPNTFGGRITVRNVVPSGGDARPVAGQLTTWDAYPPITTIAAISDTGSGVTITAAQLFGGAINRTGPTGSFSDATDTAAHIIAQFIPGAVVGSSFLCHVANGSSQQMTITPGSGVTFEGTLSSSNFVLASGATRLMSVVVTNVGSPAVTIMA